jgi:hypothetical protein
MLHIAYHVYQVICFQVVLAALLVQLATSLTQQSSTVSLVVLAVSHVILHSFVKCAKMATSSSPPMIQLINVFRIVGLKNMLVQLVLHANHAFILALIALRLSSA